MASLVAYFDARPGGIIRGELPTPSAAGHPLGRAQVPPGQRRDLRDGERDVGRREDGAGEIRGGREEVGLLERPWPRTACRRTGSKRVSRSWSRGRHARPASTRAVTVAAKTKVLHRAAVLRPARELRGRLLVERADAMDRAAARPAHRLAGLDPPVVGRRLRSGARPAAAATRDASRTYARGRGDVAHEERFLDDEVVGGEHRDHGPGLAGPDPVRGQQHAGRGAPVAGLSEHRDRGVPGELAPRRGPRGSPGSPRRSRATVGISRATRSSGVARAGIGESPSPPARTTAQRSLLESSMASVLLNRGARRSRRTPRPPGRSGCWGPRRRSRPDREPGRSRRPARPRWRRRCRSRRSRGCAARR